MSEQTTVHMWTDGACKGNPGPGGWGVLMTYGEHRKELFGGEALTTNNRMELLAVIRGLESLTRSSDVHLHVDSSYVMNGMMKWIQGWKSNGWRTADKKPVKNVISGEGGALLINNPRFTERADELANQGVDQVR